MVCKIVGSTGYTLYVCRKTDIANYTKLNFEARSKYAKPLRICYIIVVLLIRLCKEAKSQIIASKTNKIPKTKRTLCISTECVFRFKIAYLIVATRAKIGSPKARNFASYSVTTLPSASSGRFRQTSVTSKPNSVKLSTE